MLTGYQYGSVLTNFLFTKNIGSQLTAVVVVVAGLRRTTENFEFFRGSIIKRHARTWAPGKTVDSRRR